MQTMYPGKVNSPKTLTAAIIGASDTTVEVSDGSVLPAAPNLAVLGAGEDCETILYTVKIGNVLSGITRGFQGVAKGWDADTPVARNFTEYDQASAQANIAELSARFAASTSVIFVSKQGDDSNAGTRAFAPRLTIGAAMTAAAALISGGAPAAVVRVLDAGTYAENITVPAGVMLDAPSATFVGAMTVGNGCSVRAHALMPSASDTVAVTKAGTAISMVDADVWEGRGADGTLTDTTLAYNSVAGAILYATGRTFNVAEDGWGVRDNASDSGHIHMSADDVYLFGDNAVGAEVQGPNSHIVIVAQHIITVGESDTTALKSSNSSARIEATTNEITATVAALANTGAVAINCPKITGTLTGAGVSVVGRLVGATEDYAVFVGADGVLAAKDASAARSAIGAAASTHAHGNITNAGKVGSTADLPMFTLTGGAVGTKSKDDAKIALDIDPRGFEYGGREIPFTWAQISSKIKAGDFTGLRVGDYKDIVLNGTFYDAAAAGNKTMSNLTFRMEIAGIDSYYQYGDAAVPHHIDFISRDCYSETLLYNASDTNSGSFIGSALFTTLNGANGIVKLLPSDVAAVTIIKRGLTETKTGASASGWAWNDMGKLWIPTEREVWGNPTWSEISWGGGLNVQYPIFKEGTRHIIKQAGIGGGRCYWWCASSVAGSATGFCFVSDIGNPSNATAAYAYLRVPLCFRVA